MNWKGVPRFFQQFTSCLHQHKFRLVPKPLELACEDQTNSFDAATAQIR